MEDAEEGLLISVTPKGRHPAQQRVEHHASRPHIRRIAAAFALCVGRRLFEHCTLHAACTPIFVGFGPCNEVDSMMRGIDPLDARHLYDSICISTRRPVHHVMD